MIHILNIGAMPIEVHWVFIVIVSWWMILLCPWRTISIIHKLDNKVEFTITQWIENGLKMVRLAKIDRSKS